MKPKKNCKLRLSKETIYNLNDLQMRKIYGGETETVGCTAYCTQTCQTYLMCTGCKPSKTYCD